MYMYVPLGSVLRIPLCRCCVLTLFSVVEFQTASDARSAIETLQDTDLMGRLIFLREDREASLVAPPATMGRGTFGGGGPAKGGNCKVCIPLKPCKMARILAAGTLRRNRYGA